MFGNTMKIVAFAGVVSLAVSFGMLHAAPATQAAQAGDYDSQFSVPALARSGVLAVQVGSNVDF